MHYEVETTSTLSATPCRNLSTPAARSWRVPKPRDLSSKMAEGPGFEPGRQVHPTYPLSRRALSTTQPPFRVVGMNFGRQAPGAVPRQGGTREVGSPMHPLSRRALASSEPPPRDPEAQPARTSCLSLPGSRLTGRPGAPKLLGLRCGHRKEQEDRHQRAADGRPASSRRARHRPWLGPWTQAGPRRRSRAPQPRLVHHRRRQPQRGFLSLHRPPDPPQPPLHCRGPRHATVRRWRLEP